MAANPAWICNVLGCCKEPEIEKAQPRWWETLGEAPAFSPSASRPNQTMEVPRNAYAPATRQMKQTIQPPRNAYGTQQIKQPPMDAQKNAYVRSYKKVGSGIPMSQPRPELQRVGLPMSQPRPEELQRIGLPMAQARPELQRMVRPRPLK
eukprot:GHVO01050495.1.p1 GENE.GHVO01050495.1~~GHVO01050495.1.p1  ORF type:complete len:150 (-),score=11.23 GHVO01050495.1:210-659(-)